MPGSLSLLSVQPGACAAHDHPTAVRVEHRCTNGRGRSRTTDQQPHVRRAVGAGHEALLHVDLAAAAQLVIIWFVLAGGCAHRVDEVRGQ